MLDKIVMFHAGKKVEGECLSTGVTTNGLARPSNASWKLTVDGVTREGFPGSPYDTEESVSIQIMSWAQQNRELFYDQVPYRGYMIRATPKQLRDLGDWTLDIQIGRQDHGQNTWMPAIARDTFKTRTDAVAAGFKFGAHIIDGNVPGLSVDDL